MVALYRVDLPASALGVEIGPASAQEVLARRPDQYAVLDGPMFDARGPQYCLRDRKRGVDIASRFPSRGAIICVVAGRAQARRGGMPMAGSTVCVQGYPSLVEAGVVVATRSRDTELVGRAAVVLRRDGNVSLVAARAASMFDFAEALADQLDAEWAIYTDGGSSTALVTRETEMLDLARRRLPSWIVARRDPSLASLDPSLASLADGPSSGLHPLVLAGGAIAAGAALYWLFGDD